MCGLCANLAACHAGSKANYVLWLAELGKAEKLWMFAGMHNILDVCSTAASIAQQWQWSESEKEVALYDSEHFYGHPKPV